MTRSVAMLKALLNRLMPPDYLKLSRRARLVLAILTGISVSVLAAGFFLSRTRRRYRAISATSFDARSVGSRSSGRGTLNRSSTFRGGTEDGESERALLPNRPSHKGSSTAHSEPVGVPHGGSVEERDGERQNLDDVDFDRDSISSSDSFHSTVESLDDSDLLGCSGFYLSALTLARKGGVTCRNIRTKMLKCKDDFDFLAKVHCIRLAFDEIISSSHNRDYFKVTARQIVSSFLSSTNQDASEFCNRFDDLTGYMENEAGWKVAVEELTKRKVVCMNVYDIALDFVLLDAFDDIEHPPSAIVTVLSNTWITAGIKQSMISTAIWSLLKAKTRMLTHRDGFMSRFYLMSETLSPTLAWGFLGNDQRLKDKCIHFKAVTMEFICSIFSLDSVDYTSIHTLASNILTLAKNTASNMHSPDTDNGIGSL